MNTFKNSIFFVVLSIVIYTLQQVNGERITDLPGLNSSINFKQYSGYITVDEVKKTRLFYWYVESQFNATTAPLVLWLNGGPGCSSLGGFFEELGPFYVTSNMQLGINDYSWNRIANMIFLEAPAGVGFSKTDTPIEYNDEKTASDSMQFLIKFFQMYPHLKTLDFWMTGESYAGHYIPTLATKVLEYNKAAASSDVIHLKGLMIGNPFTILSLNNGAIVETSYSHHLISIGTYVGLRENCNYTFPDVLDEQSIQIDPAKCNTFQERAASEMGNINPYDIYADVCLSGRSQSHSNGLALLKYFARANKEMSTFAYGVLKQHLLRSPYYPCQDNYLQTYLNDPAVQKAIFAEPTKWRDCSDMVGNQWLQSDVAASMIPYYTDHLFNNDLKILIYSGDVDTVVPAASTRSWLHSLKLNNTVPWHPWTDSRGQVGGYTSSTKEVTFSTVRNAGHEVPTFQPIRAFDMFSRFLRGNL